MFLLSTNIQFFLLCNLIITNISILLNCCYYLLYVSGSSITVSPFTLFVPMYILPEVSLRLSVFFETFCQIWIDIQICNGFIVACFVMKMYTT